MTLAAVFFDVGDTLVQHWKPREEIAVIMRERLAREFGERDWYDRFLGAEIAPASDGTGDEEFRQETSRWYAEWFRNSQIGIDDIEMDRLLTVVSVPLDLVGTLVPGTAEALRWCKRQGLQIGLVTNTLSRGDPEVRRDWERFGLAEYIDVVASSHSTGWQKPHEKIFRRALSLAHVAPDDAVMVGDRLRQDVLGAKRVGMRAVWRRPLPGAPEQDDVDAAPDATIDDLTELPAILSRWL